MCWCAPPKLSSNCKAIQIGLYNHFTDALVIVTGRYMPELNSNDFFAYAQRDSVRAAAIAIIFSIDI